MRGWLSKEIWANGCLNGFNKFLRVKMIRFGHLDLSFALIFGFGLTAQHFLWLFVEAADGLNFRIYKMEELKGGKCWPLETVGQSFSYKLWVYCSIFSFGFFFSVLPGKSQDIPAKFFFLWIEKKGNPFALCHLLCTSVKVASAQW